MAKVTEANYAAKLKAAILNAAITGKLTGGTSGWKTVKLGEVCDYGKCTSIQSSEIEDGVWSLDLEDIERDTGKLLSRVRFGARRAKGTRHVFKKGQLLYSKLRTYLNKVLIADEDGVCTTEIIPLDFGEEVLPDYARIVLMSQMVLDYTASCCYGVKMPRLGTHDGKMIPFPLPPLAIQREIVGKVEELIGLVEVVQEGGVKIRELGEKARAKILDLAIHGALVAQDPAEPPAAVASSVTTPPYALPPNWKWVKLGEVCEILDSKRKPITKTDRKSGIYPYYGATGIVDYVDEYLFDERLVLLGEDGAKWGMGDNSSFIIDGKTWVNNHAHVLRTKGCVLDDWLVISTRGQDLSKFITGTTVPKLNQKRMCEILIPLPPFGEQKRIVEKVEAMMKALEGLGAGF